jgi:hypothetical protein
MRFTFFFFRAYKLLVHSLTKHYQILKQASIYELLHDKTWILAVVIVLGLITLFEILQLVPYLFHQITHFTFLLSDTLYAFSAAALVSDVDESNARYIELEEEG